MELIKSLVLSSALVHFVLAIVLGGILITEYYKRKEKFRGGMFGYGIFLITIIGFLVLDTYRNLIVSLRWINWICLVFAVLANVLFVVTSLRYFKYINKGLFFSIPLFSISIVMIEVLRLLYANKSFGIYTAIATLAATSLGYFVIIGFLINTSGVKNE